MGGERGEREDRGWGEREKVEWCHGRYVAADDGLAFFSGFEVIFPADQIFTEFYDPEKRFVGNKNFVMSLKITLTFLPRLKGLQERSGAGFVDSKMTKLIVKRNEEKNWFK